MAGSESLDVEKNQDPSAGTIVVRLAQAVIDGCCVGRVPISESCLRHRAQQHD
jgi:hypothetical protein